MKPEIRTPTTGDRESIRVALDAALYRSLAPSGSKHSNSTVSYLCDDAGYTTEMVIQNVVDAVIIDESYLLVFSVVKPWYSKNMLALSEDLVLKIGTGSTFAAVAATLDYLAEINECNAIVTGGALTRSSRALTRMYRRFGYELEDGAPKFTKRR